jgi:hypothetical protein
MVSLVIVSIENDGSLLSISQSQQYSEDIKSFTERNRIFFADLQVFRGAGKSMQHFKSVNHVILFKLLCKGCQDK